MLSKHSTFLFLQLETFTKQIIVTIFINHYLPLPNVYQYNTLLHTAMNFSPKVEQSVDGLFRPHSRPVEHQFRDLPIRITNPSRQRRGFLPILAQYLRQEGRLTVSLGNDTKSCCCSSKEYMRG